MVTGSFLKNRFQGTSFSKRNVLSVWMGIFLLFAGFWVKKLKPFSGKVRQSVQNCLNKNLVIRSFLKNSFEALLSSKTNVLSTWKENFSVFWKFSSAKVETIFWEWEANAKTYVNENLHIRNFWKPWTTLTE